MKNRGNRWMIASNVNVISVIQLRKRFELSRKMRNENSVFIFTEDSNNFPMNYDFYIGFANSLRISQRFQVHFEFQVSVSQKIT